MQRSGHHRWLADGKIYVGDEDGDIAILRDGKKIEVIAEINMGGAVYTTAHPKNGTCTSQQEKSCTQ